MPAARTRTPPIWRKVRLAKLTDDDGELTNGDDRSATYASILRHASRDFVEVEGTTGMAMEILKYSMASYGAQFCEVRVNEDTGELRISRWLGSFDCGRIVNPKTATSQFRGGIIMGIGAALMEETAFDERRGRIMNPSLAAHHVPAHLDIPDIDIIYTDIADPHSPLGARGVGEIGITGPAPAVANAVFNATGQADPRPPDHPRQASLEPAPSHMPWGDASPPRQRTCTCPSLSGLSPW